MSYTDKLKMALRARKVFGAFEKQAPDLRQRCNIEKKKALEETSVCLLRSS